MGEDTRPRRTIALTRGEKWFVYSAGAGVWLTGMLWLVYEHFFRVDGEFGPEHNPLEALWQKLHGGFGYFAVFAFGLLWAIHAVPGWNANWRRWSGGTLFGVTTFLALSGVALYYISGDAWRDAIGFAHWAVGIAALAAFLIHWLSRSRPKRG